MIDFQLKDSQAVSRHCKETYMPIFCLLLLTNITNISEMNSCRDKSPVPKQAYAIQFHKTNLKLTLPTHVRDFPFNFATHRVLQTTFAFRGNSLHETEGLKVKLR